MADLWDRLRHRDDAGNPVPSADQIPVHGFAQAMRLVDVPSRIAGTDLSVAEFKSFFNLVPGNGEEELDAIITVYAAEPNEVDKKLYSEKVIALVELWGHRIISSKTQLTDRLGIV